MKTKRIAQLAAAITLAGAASLPAASPAQAATIVAWDVDVIGLCRAMGYQNTRELDRSPNGWVCVNPGQSHRLTQADFTWSCRNVVSKKVPAARYSYAALQYWHIYGWRCYR